MAHSRAWVTRNRKLEPQDEAVDRGDRIVIERDHGEDERCDLGEEGEDPSGLNGTKGHC